MVQYINILVNLGHTRKLSASAIARTKLQTRKLLVVSPESGLFLAVGSEA